jgi:nucleoid-associated protein YgaU
MILAVAIYQWGGAGNPAGGTVTEVTGPQLTVRTLAELEQADKDAAPKASAPDAAAPDWSPGIPKTYRIAKDDKVWVIVVKRWGLKESFIKEIEAANPKIDFKRLRPGMDLLVPDPSRFVRSASEPAPAPAKAGSTRRYEVQGGDTLESIAYRHLGSKTRWPDIVGLNPGLEPKRLFEGQEIYLPLK